MSLTTSARSEIRSLHWFRKGLRLHDNPSLLAACESATHVYPVFCIDPYFAKPDIVGINRYHFLLESLQDLDSSLRKLGSRLYILQGKPEEQLLLAIQKWQITRVTYESDIEPYAKIRDKRLNEIFQSNQLEVITFPTHTLNDLDRYISLNKGKIISNAYQSFQKIFESIPEEDRVARDLPPPSSLPPIPNEDKNNPIYDVPTLQQMGYDPTQVTTIYHGGETVALQRMEEYLQQKKWILTFAKPDTSPNSLQPSTTVLSPYLKFGCLSVRKFYHGLNDIYKLPRSLLSSKSTSSSSSSAKDTATAEALKLVGITPTKPPVSLIGQLLWREFFYLQAFITPNFDRMVGNAQCRQIPWDRNPDILTRWKLGQTGFPFIDAIMTQLRLEGWIHHLARHMVACFLTRGDLWQHWEEGVKIFDLYLLDDDWALNNANWQWLSCSNFFYQYFRIYSPISFGKKTDPSGEYIRKYLPQLKGFPDKYIYEPWKAPKLVQQQANCIIGKDYPLPIVDHDVVSKENMNKMKAAYALHQQQNNVNDINYHPVTSSSSSKTKKSNGNDKVANMAPAARNQSKNSDEDESYTNEDNEDEDEEDRVQQRKDPRKRNYTQMTLLPQQKANKKTKK